MADDKIGYGGTPLGKLAKQIQKPKSSGNESLDDKRKSDFRYMVDIVDRMEKKTASSLLFMASWSVTIWRLSLWLRKHYRRNG